MTQLETLIQTLCPNGVKFVKLGEVAEVQYGYPFNASLFTDKKNEKPIIRIRDIVPAKTSTYYLGDVQGLENYIIRKGDILLGMDGYFNMDKWDSEDAYLNQRVCKISAKSSEIALDGFLFHYLKPQFKKIEQTTAGGSVIHLSAKIINNLQIPLPPLAVQSEIVRVLDKFTLYKSELAAELAARLQQYEYYRDQLLTFDDTVKRVKLGEVAEIYTGGEPPKDTIKGDIKDSVHQYPVWGNGKDIYGYSSTYRIDKDAAVISSIGANTGAVYYREAFFTPIIRLKVVVPKVENLLSKYLYYYLSTVSFAVKSSSVPNMNASEVKNISIPLPPLSEQERIVSILDRFDKLCHDIREGLPAEIELRQKQYEHYRDKLLTFDAKG